MLFQALQGSLPETGSRPRALPTPRPLSCCDTASNRGHLAFGASWAAGRWGQQVIQTSLCPHWAVFKQGCFFCNSLFLLESFVICFYKWYFICYQRSSAWRSSRKGCFQENIQKAAVSKHSLACVLSKVAHWAGSIGKECFVFLLSLLLSFESTLLYLLPFLCLDHFHFNPACSSLACSCWVKGPTPTLVLHQSTSANCCLSYLTYILWQSEKTMLLQQSGALDLLITGLRTG